VTFKTKGEVVAVLKQAPLRLMWEQKNSSTHSQPWHLRDTHGLFHTVAHLTPGKEPLVPTQSWVSPTTSHYTVERTVSFASHE